MARDTGVAHLSAGLGIWQFVFCAPMTYPRDRFIGVAWALHAAWDVVHHLYANPIVPFAPTSSAGCAICDLALAGWYLVGAPTLRRNRPREAHLLPD